MKGIVTQGKRTVALSQAISEYCNYAGLLVGERGNVIQYTRGYHNGKEIPPRVDIASIVKCIA